MKFSDIRENMLVMVNDSGDLAFMGDQKQFIGTEVRVIKKTKAGLVQVESDLGITSLPAKNIDFPGLPTP